MSALTPKGRMRTSFVINTTILKDWLNESLFIYVCSFIGILYRLASIKTNCIRFNISQNLFIRIVEFCTIFQSPTLERDSGLFDLRQSTMAAASAARTALCGWFGVTETALLASVGAGAHSVHMFCEEELFWRLCSRLTWQRCARRRERPRRRHRNCRRRCGWRYRRHNLLVDELN